MQSFFVYGRTAYRSELDLFRAERVTARECEIVTAPAGTQELYRVERSDFPELITHDMTAALSAFKEGMQVGGQDAHLVSVNVVR